MVPRFCSTLQISLPKLLANRLLSMKYISLDCLSQASHIVKILSPIFKKIYNIYSRGDKVQRFDIFSPCDFFSHREFKGCLPGNLIQIEMKITDCLRRNPEAVLPQRMRGMYNQSPGHIELWFFGWASSSFRKNLSIYPIPGAVFIPYLICASNKVPSPHIVVDIRPGQENICIKSRCDYRCDTLPFMKRGDLAAFIAKAMQFHPCNTKYHHNFARMKATVKAKEYV